MISYKRIFHIFVLILFFSYLVLYFAQKNGYYDELNNKKSYLTEEKIKEFEKDVEKGKKIDVNNYVIDMKKDYSTKVSDFGLFTSNLFSKYFKYTMNKIFNEAAKNVNN